MCAYAYVCVSVEAVVRVRVREGAIFHDSFVLLGRAVAWLYDVCLCMTLLLCVLKFLL